MGDYGRVGRGLTTENLATENLDGFRQTSSYRSEQLPRARIESNNKRLFVLIVLAVVIAFSSAVN